MEKQAKPSRQKERTAEKDLIPHCCGWRVPVRAVRCYNLPGQGMHQGITVCTHGQGVLEVPCLGQQGRTWSDPCWIKALLLSVPAGFGSQRLLEGGWRHALVILTYWMEAQILCWCARWLKTSDKTEIVETLDYLMSNKSTVKKERVHAISILEGTIMQEVLLLHLVSAEGHFSCREVFPGE